MSENDSSNFMVRHQNKFLIGLLAFTASFAIYQNFVLRRYQKMVNDLLKKVYPENYKG